MDSLSEFLSALTAYEAGGRGLAFAPTGGPKLELSESMTIGGSVEAVEFFKKSMAQGDQAMLFLLGAPGNGKSYLLSKVKEGLVPLGDHSRDRRRFDFQIPGASELIVVNDASAPAESGESFGQLVSDMSDAISNQKFLHANVNRGVLYQELRSNIQNESIAEVIGWLSNPSHIEDSWKHLKIQEPNSESSVRNGKLRISADGEERIISIVVVMMDFYSILEQQPKHEIQQSGDWTGFPVISSGQKYVIQKPQSPNRKSMDFWLGTPGGQLLSEVVKKGNSLVVGPVDPFNVIVSNLKSLDNAEFFTGVLCALRNTELISSQHISFREMWTGIATMIIGDGDARQSIESAAILRMNPFEWVKLATSHIPQEHSRERIAELTRIAATRTHQSIFGALQSPFDEKIDRGISPLLALTRLADPVRDSIPNFGQGKQATGWVSPVVDALRGQIGDLSIVKALKSNAKERTIDFHYSDFDLVLDNEVTRLIASDYANEPIIDRSELEAVLIWYGDYLTRMYAMSIGVSAFENDLKTWVGAWTNAQIEKRPPEQLRKAILSLLLPLFYSNETDDTGHRLVSVLTARTEALTDIAHRPRLAIEINGSPAFKASTNGDQLLMEIRDDDGSTLLKLDADFVFVREALACTEWPEAFTEHTSSLKPKIERLRASMINRSSVLGSIRLIDGRSIESVQVKQ